MNIMCVSEMNIIIYMYMWHLLYSPMGGHLGRFRILATVNNIAMSRGCNEQGVR